MSNLFHSWLKSVQRRSANPERRVKHSPESPRQRRTRPAVEQLEDRLVPTTFLVNSLADTDFRQAGVNQMTGAINGTHTVTLRSALAAANLTQGDNTIDLTVAGTYKVTQAPDGTLATGAFRILGGAHTTGLTIVNASRGAVTVDGNHLDRVFDINPTFDPVNPTPAFTVTMQGFTITGGSVSPGDEAAGSGGGIRDIGNASLTLNNVIVTNNVATADGGGIAMENTVSVPWTLTVNSSTISNNHAGDAGGGIETDGTGKVFVGAGTVITGNTCVNQGAGIWLDAISGIVTSVTVTNPGVKQYFLNDTPTVAFVSVDGNGSGAAGTAVQNANFNIVGVTVTNRGSGYDLPPRVVFVGNALTGTPDTTAVANVALNQSATLTVTGATISNNQALTGPGGGIGNAGSSAVTITGSTIANNSSGMSGGGFGDQNNFGTLAVANSLFLNNVAVGPGGGISERGPMTTISNTEIMGNASGDSGGGLRVGGTTLIVQNSTIANNTASNAVEGGGGIDLLTTGTGLHASTITNTTITGNRALNNAGNALGGGICATSLVGDLVLLSDTIDSNYAFAGGGVAFLGFPGTTCNVANTIIAGNTAVNGVDAFNASSNFTDNGGNLIGVAAGDANTGFTAGTTQTGTRAAPLNALLAPLGNNGGSTIGAPGTAQVLQTQALQVGSPAIGRATLFGAPAFDERGLAGLVNGAIDVGAVSAVVTPPPLVTHVNAIMPLVSQKTVNGVLTTTFSVNSTLDTHTPSAGTLTLRDALDFADNLAGNKIIQLLVPGDYRITLPGANTGTNASGAFAILPSGGNVTILNASGGVATVDGNHTDRVFDINPGDDTNVNDKFTVTLQGITITNGIAQPGDRAAGSGGGIRDQGIASLTLNNVVLTNNIATADGGGLSMENAASAPWTLTVNSSTISNNHAGDAGGGIETDGTGKVFVGAGTVITGNTCVNQGAGIWLDAIASATQFAPPGTVASVTITNRGSATYLASALGLPAIHFTSVDGKGSGAAATLLVDANGVPIGITVTNPGSGYDMPPTVSFTFEFFNPNITAVATLTPVQEGASLNVTGTLISNNDALTMLGGGIGNAGAGAVTITNSTIANNFTVGTGGGFADSNNQGTLTVSTSVFLNNAAVGSGGAIQEGGPATTITSTELAGNVSGNSGGALFADGSTLTVLNSTLANNIASGDGNGLGGGAIELQTTGTSGITNTTLSGNRALNSAGANGGGIDAAALTGTVRLLNDTVNANFASNGGGVFWGGLSGSVFSVENTILAQNLLASGGTGLDADTAAGPFTDLGGNLIGVAGDANTGFTAGTTQTGTLAAPLNPLLGPLTNNRGPMIGATGTAMVLQTEAVQMGSKARGKGIKAGAPPTDERGVANGPVITVGAANA